MAKLCGEIKVIGTVGNLCFYERKGEYLVRAKPGPDRTRFLKSKRFEPNREACTRMNKGNKIAAVIYRHIPKEKKEYQLNCELQKKAALLFKTDLDVEEITRILCDSLVEEGYLKDKAIDVILQQVEELDFYSCLPGKGKRRNYDHFEGVKICTKEGRWIRIYHWDEWRLLQEYSEEMKEGDNWVASFLERRKKLKSYRLKHRYKRKPKRMADVRGGNVRCKISDVRCGETGYVKVNRVPKVGKYFETVSKVGIDKEERIRRLRRRMEKRCGIVSFEVDEAQKGIVDST